jgi:small subunit ribosomal protein S2
MSKVTFEELLDAGCHFGHLRRKWNPAMAQYIFMEKNGIHILDLNKTLVKLEEACAAAKQISKSGRKILFVATKKQAKETISELAKSVNMPYVTERWPGGMLTNFFTIRKAVKKMSDIDKLMSGTQFDNLAKREKLQIQRERAKLEKNLGSISDLSRLPAAIFIVDILKEHIAVAEARRLNITTFAMVDTNSNPNLIDFPVPANDDASKSITLIVKAICDAIAEGATERKLDREAQEEDASDDLSEVNEGIDEEEERSRTEVAVEVKGVKKIKDVATDEESSPTKRKRIPTKKAPAKK